MRPEDGPTVKTISCIAKGKRCTAIAKDRTKWTWDAHSESEAQLMAEAVADRGFVYPKFWRQQ